MEEQEYLKIIDQSVEDDISMRFADEVPNLFAKGGKNISDKNIKIFAGRFAKGIAESQMLDLGQFTSIGIHEIKGRITLLLADTVGFHHRQEDAIENVLRSVYYESEDIRNNMDLCIEYSSIKRYRSVVLEDHFYKKRSTAK